MDTDRMVVTQYRGAADKLRDSELEARVAKWGYAELEWEDVPSTVEGAANLRRLTALPQAAVKRRAQATAKAYDREAKAAAWSSSSESDDG